MSNPTEVIMPLMGEGITEATLVRWLKSPGEAVQKEEPLLEVSTDKVDTEIPAPASGFLVQTFADEGATVEINAVIAHIADNPGGSADKTNGAEKPSLPPPPQKAATTSGSAPKSAAARTAPVTLPATPAKVAHERTGPTKSSPLVRKIAKEKNIDLNGVPGSGLGGRITKKDLEEFIAAGGNTSQGGSVLFTQPPLLGRVATKMVDGSEVLDGVPVRREAMSKIRRLTAEHMVESVRTSPHVTTVFEMDLHAVEKVRNKHKDEFFKREGFKLTYTPIFLHATALAIKEHPIVNVSVDGTDILYKNQINLGCAVAIESGLIVPVIKDAGGLNLTGMASRLNDLVTRARSKKLKPEDMQGGTFSITNPGMFGSVVSTPIINQPQVAILAIGAVIQRPVVIDGMIGVRPLCQIGLTFDHRVIDGEGGAKFLATLKRILEEYSDVHL